MTGYLIALGSNAAFDSITPSNLICSAILQIAEFGQIIAQSAVYRTPAFPAGSGADYANAAVALTSTLSPNDLLTALHSIEADLGRIREKRWASRTLDLDILAAEDQIHPNETLWRHWAELPLEAQMQTTPQELILPHPRLQDRAFVLRPLADIAPNWRHPLLGKTTKEMLAARPVAEQAEITLW